MGPLYLCIVHVHVHVYVLQVHMYTVHVHVHCTCVYPLKIEAGIPFIQYVIQCSAQLHGAAYGKGIYLSPLSSVSFGYTGYSSYHVSPLHVILCHFYVCKYMYIHGIVQMPMHANAPFYILWSFILNKKAMVVPRKNISYTPDTCKLQILLTGKGVACTVLCICAHVNDSLCAVNNTQQTTHLFSGLGFIYIFPSQYGWEKF